MRAVVIHHMYCSVSIVLTVFYLREVLFGNWLTGSEATDNSTKNYSSDLGSNVARTFPNYLIWSGTWNRNCFQKWKITGKHPVFLKTATFLFSTERFLIFWGPCFSLFDFSPSFDVAFHVSCHPSSLRWLLHTREVFTSYFRWSRQSNADRGSLQICIMRTC